MEAIRHEEMVMEQEEPVAVMGPEPKLDPWEYSLRKYVLMLATLVATVTYGVGFNPPGGVWQENDGATGHRAGEAIVRTTNNLRYLVFFYCNAVALASSVVVIVLFLLLYIDLIENKEVVWIRIKPLRVLMVLDLLSFMGAYAAGSCRDMLTTVYTSVLMAAGVSTYFAVQVVLASRPDEITNNGVGVDLKLEGRLRKVLMVLATFAVSITYVAGLNSPGGFWDNTGAGHHLGDAILNDSHHKARLATFFICNSTAFMVSLLIIMLLLGRKLHQRTVRSHEMFGCLLVALVGLVGAYAAGTSREPAATAYVVLLVAASLLCIHLLQDCLHKEESQPSTPISGTDIIRVNGWADLQSPSLLLLLATFATAITYQAGLDPPGGVWQENSTDGHLAGDPILLTKNASRYRTFFYCNSYTLLSSLVTIIIFLWRYRFERTVMIRVIMLELFGLIGAYAAGATRDVSTSIYIMALGGAVLFCTMVHISSFAIMADPTDSEIDEVEKKRKLLYLLATLSMSMTYQAGLTPPGGFFLQDDNETGNQAGDPVLLFNHPLRYKAFLYCNSVSFMVSVITMILLVNPYVYRPAILGHALTLCAVVGLSGLMGAYAAGSEYPTTSIGIFVLLVVAFLIVVVLLLLFFVKAGRRNDEERVKYMDADPVYAQRKHLMLLEILVAGVTYQAGLDPPGGVWQGDEGGHEPGAPAMRDNRRQRYLVYFYGNSTSFAASIVVILLLLLQWLKRKEILHSWAILKIVQLNLLALLVAYAAGSSRDWKSSVSVVALAIPVTTYLALHVVIAVRSQRRMHQYQYGHTPPNVHILGSLFPTTPDLQIC